MNNLIPKIETIVLGATGKVGLQVIKSFSEAGIACKAVTRSPQKQINLPFVNWIQGDLTDKANLDKLFEGTRKLFLNTGVSGDMAQTQINIIDAAKSVGIEHIVKLSTPSASPVSKDLIAQKHWEVEEYLKNSGLHWNILHPQSFMQNWLGDLAQSAKTERRLYSAAGNGKKAFIDTRDIGEVVFALFIGSQKHINKTIPLSGPELVNYQNVAEAIGKAIGETVTYIPQSAEKARIRMLKKGIPEWAIQVTLAIELSQKEGTAESLISSNVQEILGKRARSIDDFARDYYKTFK